MKQLTFKEKEYQIPETFGQLPSKKALNLYDAINKLQKGEISINDYNYLYVSEILSVSISELEEASFEDYMTVLSSLNAILVNKTEPILKDELEAKEKPE